MNSQVPYCFGNLSFLLVSLARGHHNGCVCVGIFCVRVSLCIIRWKFCPWLLEFLLKQSGTVKCAGSSLDQLHTFLLDYLSSMCVMSAFVYDLNWMHTSSQVEHCGINEERSNEFLAESKNFVYDKLLYFCYSILDCQYSCQGRNMHRSMAESYFSMRSNHSTLSRMKGLFASLLQKSLHIARQQSETLWKDLSCENSENPLTLYFPPQHLLSCFKAVKTTHYIASSETEL